MGVLATVTDLTYRMGRSLTTAESARATALLVDASAAFRQAANGQTIDAVSADTLTRQPKVLSEQYRPLNWWELNITGYGWAVQLPQRPITAVSSVVDATSSAAVNFLWNDGDDIVVVGSMNRVTITYDHGYATVPDDVVAVVCQIVARALGNPAESSGVQQESIGGYSYTIGSAAASGPVGMLDSERKIAESYGRRVGAIRML